MDAGGGPRSCGPTGTRPWDLYAFDLHQNTSLWKSVVTLSALFTGDSLYIRDHMPLPLKVSSRLR
jgi:hypothetical protein